jgi:hypothetical protein
LTEFAEASFHLACDLYIAEDTANSNTDALVL